MERLIISITDEEAKLLVEMVEKENRGVKDHAHLILRRAIEKENVRKDQLPTNNFQIIGLELDALKIMAFQEGRALSKMINECIREAACKRGVIPLCFASDFSKIIKTEVQYEEAR